MNTGFRLPPQMDMNFGGLVFDNFAGGGGASTGIEAALNRWVDHAINHNPDAIRMHETNHPNTHHHCESVWDIDPRTLTNGRTVDLAWFSPDCRHFSKAKGSTPVEKTIRGLAWIKIRYALLVRPKVMPLENVEEFKTWGPLGPDQKTIKEQSGETFHAFVSILTTGIEKDHPGYLECLETLDIKPDSSEADTLAKGLGYKTDHRELRACDYGAPTTRKRFFMISRCDDQPICWPEPTHGDPKSEAVLSGNLKPWKTAADIIDWSIPCPSIFERKRPLAENTLRRIARGIQKFVIDNPEPFIVRIGHTGFGGAGLQYQVDKPLTTITSKNEHLLVTPIIERQFGKSTGNAADAPLATITAGGGGKAALCTALIAKHNGGATGHKATDPLHTITGRGTQLQVVTSHLIKLRGTCQHGQPVSEPMPTITAGGTHVGEVRAFLLKYYGNERDGCNLNNPLHTVPTKDRFGLVTVHGQDYQIIDIGMRMLEPHELFAAQGFPKDYIFDRDHTGKKITKTAQVARCGNAVCPPVAEAIVRANMAEKVREVVAA